MREEPLFNDDILISIYRHFNFFFTWSGLIVYAAIVLAVLFLNWLLVRFLFKREKLSLLPDARYAFVDAPAAKWGGVTALALSFAAYAAATLTQENTLLNNFDLMSVNAIKNMYWGNLPIVDPIRFTPLSNLDQNLVYAVTRNYAVIDYWIVFKQFICLFLLYRFFSFIPVVRRLFLLAVINFLPAVFVVNNMIHTEQLILIFVLLSFMFLDKYAATQRASYLLWFTVFANLAVYTKETAVLFYAGLLGYMILRRVFCGEIGLESFLSPFKTVARMPAEYMLFWTLFIFLTCYLLLQDPRVDDAYLQTHHAALPVVVAINKLVLGLNVLALLLWSVKTLRRKEEKNNLLCEGVLLGCTLVTAVVVFKLQVVVIPDYYKTYYLYLQAVFCSGYIFSFFRRRLWLWALFSPIVLYAGYVNYNTYMREEGEARRGVAEFIVSRAENEAVSIYVYSQEMTAHRWWKVTGWAAALKYLYPAGDIVFKTALRFSDFHVENDMDSYEVRVAPPVPGDYILVHKINSPSFEPGKNYVPVYENEVYTIYRTGTQDD